VKILVIIISDEARAIEKSWAALLSFKSLAIPVFSTKQKENEAMKTRPKHTSEAPTPSRSLF